jgi:hypothetical protein
MFEMAQTAAAVLLEKKPAVGGFQGQQQQQLCLRGLTVYVLLQSDVCGMIHHPRRTVIQRCSMPHVISDTQILNQRIFPQAKQEATQKVVQDPFHMSVAGRTLVVVSQSLVLVFECLDEQHDDQKGLKFQNWIQ